MAVVLSVRDVVSYTPEHYNDAEGSPVYQVAPLGFRERARFRADLSKSGAGAYPSDDELVSAVLIALGHLKPDNQEQVERLVHSWDDARKSPLALNKEDDGYAQTIEGLLTLEREFNHIIQVLAPHPQVSRVLGARRLFNELAAPVMASYALRGWENVPLEFKRTAGTVDDDLLDQLPERDLVAIGQKGFQLLQPTAAQRKN